MLKFVLVIVCLLIGVSQSQSSCFCNVVSGICEVDCCCDPDCSQADVAAFSQCLGDQYLAEDERCTLSVIVWVNNINDITLTNKGNYSCVTATAASNAYEKTRCTTRGSCNKQLPPVPTSSLLLPETDLNTEIYRSGNPMLTRFEISATKSTYGFLTLPNQFAPFSFICQELDAVGYLIDDSWTCQVDLGEIGDCETSNFMRAAYHFDRYQVFRQMIDLSNSSQVNIDSLLLTINATCKNSAGALRDCSLTPIAVDNTTCIDVVTAVNLKVETNGLEGITQVSMGIVLGTITQLYVIQQYSVSFESMQPRPPDRNQFTSNNGYTMESTLTTNTSYVLSIIGTSSDNQCSLINRSPVLFGNSMTSSCVITYQPTTQCLALQNQILSFLRGSSFPTNDKLFVPSNRGSSASLVAALVEKVPALSDNRTVADGCSDLVVGMNYEMLFSKDGSVLEPQFVLSAINLGYTKTDLVFRCLGAGSCQTSEAQLQLITNVDFFDVTEQKEISYLEINKRTSSFFWPIILAIETKTAEISILPLNGAGLSSATNNYLLLAFTIIVFTFCYLL